MMHKPDITMGDIAERAGVSVATVSRVLNGQSRISAPVRQKVLEIARELGFDFEDLRRRKSPALAFFMHNQELSVQLREDELDKTAENSFFIYSLLGASSWALSENYYLHPIYCHSLDEEFRTVKRCVEQGLFQGIILSSVRERDQTIQYLQDRGFPFSVIGRPDRPQETLWVDNDNFQSAYDLTNQLLDMGFRHCAFLSGDPDYHFVADRIRGYEQAYQNRGLPLPRKAMTDWPLEHQALDAFLTEKPWEAIITMDDMVALQLINHYGDRPRPRIIGFNNSLLGQSLEPRLSSVETFPRDLGEWSVRLVLDRIKGRGGPGHKLIPTRVIWRET